MLAVLRIGVGPGVAEPAVRAFVPVSSIGSSFTISDPVYDRTLKRSRSCKKFTLLPGTIRSL